VQGLEVSRGDFLEHRIFKGLIRNDLFQPLILDFKFLHPLGLIDSETAVFFTSPDDRLRRHTNFA
jgi:hypothetical protein